MTIPLPYKARIAVPMVSWFVHYCLALGASAAILLETAAGA